MPIKGPRPDCWEPPGDLLALEPAPLVWLAGGVPAVAEAVGIVAVLSPPVVVTHALLLVALALLLLLLLAALPLVSLASGWSLACHIGRMGTLIILCAESS